MTTLKEAFDLLDRFSSLKTNDQKKRIRQVQHLLKESRRNKTDALIAIRETDQLQKQLAYMLVSSGNVKAGLKEMKSLVNEYEEKISSLHDEAAFQLYEAAIASFHNNDSATGINFAKWGLKHSSHAKNVSRTMLNALELLQKQQEK